VTPSEIAVSVVAEMLAVRSGRIADPEWRARRCGAAGGRPGSCIIGLALQALTANGQHGAFRSVAADPGGARREHVDTGEPVASQALAERGGFGVSSATLRNELARLEELGFLHQPHTSAGRVPTDAGYRCYVDLLLAAGGARAGRPSPFKPNWWPGRGMLR